MFRGWNSAGVDAGPVFCRPAGGTPVHDGVGVGSGEVPSRVLQCFKALNSRVSIRRTVSMDLSEARHYTTEFEKNGRAVGGESAWISVLAAP